MAEAKGDITVRENLTVDDNAKFQKGLDFPYLELIDEKAVDTDGGTFSAPNWVTRDLTSTIHNDFATGVVLAATAGDGGQFTIPKGVYHIEATAPAFNVGGHVARLADVTDNPSDGAAGQTMFFGTSEFSPDVDTWRDSDSSAMTIATVAQTRSRLSGRFSAVRETTTLELQHVCLTTQTDDGFGSAVFYTTNNVYSIIKMWQINDGGFGPTRPRAVAEPAASISGKSMEFLAGSDHVSVWRSSGLIPSGTADNLSAFVWIYPQDVTTDQSIAEYNRTGASIDGFQLRLMGATSGDPFEVLTRGGATTQKKVYQFGAAALNTWTHVGFTWSSGTGLIVYQDGVAKTPTKLFDQAHPAMTDPANGRQFRLGNLSQMNIGGELSANWHTFGIWSATLSAAEVLALYNGGAGDSFDPQVDSGNYSSSASLPHWFLMGKVGDPGQEGSTPWFQDSGLTTMDPDSGAGSDEKFDDDDIQVNAPTG